jgi:hypothetical protein
MAVASIRGGSTQHKWFDSSTATPPTLYANDVFAGARIALNNIQDTSLLAGVIVDIEDQSTVLSIEAERQLGEHRKLEAEIRWFIDINPTTC